MISPTNTCPICGGQMRLMIERSYKGTRPKRAVRCQTCRNRADRPRGKKKHEQDDDA